LRGFFALQLRSGWNRPFQRPFSGPVTEKSAAAFSYSYRQHSRQTDSEISVLAVRDDVSAKAAMAELATNGREETKFSLLAKVRRRDGESARMD
jgi:hypothetical protein